MGGWWSAGWIRTPTFPSTITEICFVTLGVASLSPSDAHVEAKISCKNRVRSAATTDLGLGVGGVEFQEQAANQNAHQAHLLNTGGGTQSASWLGALRGRGRDKETLARAW